MVSSTAIAPFRDRQVNGFDVEDRQCAAAALVVFAGVTAPPGLFIDHRRVIPAEPLMVQRSMAWANAAIARG